MFIVFCFRDKIQRSQTKEKEAWEETFVELCDPPNLETEHPGLDVQEPVLERQVLIFTSYQAVAVIALPKPLSQCLSSSTLRIMIIMKKTSVQHVHPRHQVNCCRICKSSCS